jgi:hypothetical protein
MLLQSIADALQLNYQCVGGGRRQHRARCGLLEAANGMVELLLI